MTASLAPRKQPVATASAAPAATATAAMREFTAMAATTTMPVSQLSCRKICGDPGGDAVQPGIAGVRPATRQ